MKPHLPTCLGCQKPNRRTLCATHGVALRVTLKTFIRQQYGAITDLRQLKTFGENLRIIRFHLQRRNGLAFVIT